MVRFAVDIFLARFPTAGATRASLAWPHPSLLNLLLAFGLCRRNAFDENGDLRSKDDLLRDVKQIGITEDTIVIPYCTGGVRSAFLYAVLRWIGLNNVANYDGSWWDWSGNPNLPVADGSLTGGSALGR